MTASRVSPSPDEIVRRYVELVRADLEPDPLFRRRLRGVVMNGFVAAREGLDEPAKRPSRMGRLGRACLYASFALAMSVGGALAASRGAAPGDLLYPLKLRLEAIRLETFPQEFHDDLLVYALSERMAEFGRLVEEGQMERAAGLAETIGAGYEELAGMGIDIDSHELGPGLAVLQALSDRLPPHAQAAIEDAMRDAPGLNGKVPAGGPPAGAASSGASHGSTVVPVDGPPPNAAVKSEGAQGGPGTTPASARPTEQPARHGPPSVEDESAPTE